MSEETLADVVSFIQAHAPATIAISGGEFTEHPKWDEYVERIADAHYGAVLLFSNGSWIFDDYKVAAMRRIAKIDNIPYIQVRTHPKYYPNYEKTMEATKRLKAVSPKVEVFDDGIRLASLGRAKANHRDEIYEGRSGPMCANVFLLARQLDLPDFRSLLNRKQTAGSFVTVCSPWVSSKGVVHAGETPYCTPLGTIKDDGSKLLKAATVRKPCNRCGDASRMSDAVLNVLGVKRSEISP